MANRARTHVRVMCVIGAAMAILPALSLAREVALQRGFADVVRPFLTANCLGCHTGDSPEAELDLGRFTSLAEVTKSFGTWQIVLERLEAGEMPPEDAERQPTDEERQRIIAWIRATRDFEAKRHAGDPGHVLARRLSSAEYDYTIRDLTGVDIQPARQFPVDPANEAGFANSGESLTMTSALLAKYLDAARAVADHVVLTPQGFDFASHPVVTEPDRDKYCVRRIIDFYKHQNTDYADYLFAAWRLRRYHAMRGEAPTLAEIAAEEHVSVKYLDRIWSILAGSEYPRDPSDDAADSRTGTPARLIERDGQECPPYDVVEPTPNLPTNDIGPLKELRAAWRSLPGPDVDQEVVRTECRRMRDYVVRLRAKLAHQFPKLSAQGINHGSQPLVLWRNRQYATHRMSLNRGVLHVLEDDGGPPTQDPDLLIPTDAREQARHIAALEEFCAVFPDTFYVAERGREFLDRDPAELEQEKKGRFLSAGFHSMMGFFRDDAPLYELILDADQQRQLDTLWRELDFITLAPLRQHRDFIWFERAESRFLITEEFDFARSEDRDVTSPERIARLRELYLAKAEVLGADDVALAAIRDHFHRTNTSIRAVEQARRDAEPRHLAALESFAQRAYRRPLSAEEREELREFYRRLRDRDGLLHEDAVRDTLVSILMSPRFLYLARERAPGSGIQPLSDFALASRLSYFLWSSTPDEPLLALAGKGELHQPEVLLQETRRMLADERVRGLATEFGGYWLDFRQFLQHNSVDRQRFPEFDDDLRRAMFEEPIRFFVDVIHNDRSVLQFLDANHTFVNATLARHYGMADVQIGPDQWVRVDQTRQYDRGGLLPMAVFLTKNAPGLRTSPVKRGYWVVRQLLGERIPAPPPNVPELPSDESQLGEPTLPEVLARHRQDKNCAACHDRFDSIGVAFEGFGPIGERRTVDLGGRPVGTTAVFPDGSARDAIGGVRDYVREQRQDEFVDNLCRKLFSYALGRTLILSDELLIREMREDLAHNRYSLRSMVERIVTSPQFLTQRGEHYHDEG